jgi:thymidylate synthase
MRQYLDLLRDVLNTGTYRQDRTKVGAYSVFGRQIRFDLSNNRLPIVTTKKIHLKSVIYELLFFISGGVDNSYLKDNGVNIWTPWEGLLNDEFPEYLGRIYGPQWRDFNGDIDQLSNVIYNLKNDPYSRRHIVSAWNPSEIEHQCLPPCHMMFQFYVEPHYYKDDERDDHINSGPRFLSCHMYQRSADLFLGLPFNITSYALLTHMIAKLCGYEAKELIISIGDAHIYSNHLEQVGLQLMREPFRCPTVKFKKDEYKSIDDFMYDDIIIEDYQYHPTIKGEVAI